VRTPAAADRPVEVDVNGPTVLNPMVHFAAAYDRGVPAVGDMNGPTVLTPTVPTAPSVPVPGSGAYATPLATDPHGATVPISGPGAGFVPAGPAPAVDPHGPTVLTPTVPVAYASAADVIDAAVAAVMAMPDLDDEEPEEPAPEVDPGRIGSTDRNMLIFVAALLALGTLAVVATMGWGRLGSGGAPRGAQPSATSTVGRVLAGQPDPARFCTMRAAKSVPHAPASGTDAWTCALPNGEATTFTVADVCHAQFGDHTVAAAPRQNDPATWRCYR
jgi:hypothetical protein